MNEPCHKCGEFHNRCFELKNLTDEEILEIAYSYDWQDGNSEWQVEIAFARAILKKASEK